MATFPYLSFDGDELELVPWAREHVALLTPSDMELDPAVVSRLLEALDAAWEYYASITGREPALAKHYNGLGTIAVVDHTCGAGCGFLGFTGIEIMREYFEAGYSALAQNGTFDQIPFYEMGRNFWFYGAQLEDIDAFVTGFAVVNRYLSMEAAGVEGSAVGVVDFEAFRHATLHDMARLYLSDESTTGTEGLTTSPPANPFGLGAADVAASLFYRIYEDFGQNSYARFWQSMGTLPAATTPQEAIGNFLAAAREATGVDYGALFKDGWELEVGDANGNVIQLAEGSTLPNAAFGFDGDDAVKGSRDGDHLFGGAGDDDLSGLRGDDVLVGAVGNDHLRGGWGDDWLGGGPGDDVLDGDRGSDWMVGGEGADTFVFSGKGSPRQVDTIADFEIGLDRLQLGKGSKIKGIQERDVNGDGVMDTVVTLKHGGSTELLGVHCVQDRGDLFIA
jgi:hypothetical protein